MKVAFILHLMQVAGAEVLVAETIRRLGSRIDPVVLCLDGVGALGERLISEGYEVVALGRRPGLDVSVSLRMARELRARGARVVHAHQYTPFFYAAVAKPLVGHRTHLMLTEHGRHYPDIVSARRRWMNRLVLSRFADEVNAVCEFSARALREREGLSGPIEVIENGIDESLYGPSDEKDKLKTALGLDASRRYITCIARFHPVKDHDALIRGFATIAQQCPDTDLLLAGDGQLRATLEEQVEATGLTTRVRFLGVRRDVPDLLRVSDVFALTSVSEGASITLLEAMATGVASVVTEVGGNPELVRREVDGLLVPRGDWHAIAAALSRLLMDSALASKLGASARQRVLDTYRLQRTIERYYARYLEADRRLGA